MARVFCTDVTRTAQGRQSAAVVHFRFSRPASFGSVRAAMNPKQPLYLCMGSACHQRGGYKLLPVLNRLLEQHGLAGRVELKGAFCLEACQQGRAVKFAGRVLTDLTEQNLPERFAAEILPLIRHA